MHASAGDPDMRSTDLGDVPSSSPPVNHSKSTWTMPFFGGWDDEFPLKVADVEGQAVDSPGI